MSSANFPSARALGDGSDPPRVIVSKTPTLRAPESSQAETVLTAAHRTAPPRRRRSALLGLPLVALLCGAAGAWLAVSMSRGKVDSAAPAAAAALAPAAPAQAPAAPPAEALAAAPAPEPEAPAVAPAAPAQATPEAESAAPAASAKPAGAAPVKVKVRTPPRKKGHDFGF
jgi:hypothetical protein